MRYAVYCCLSKQTIEAKVVETASSNGKNSKGVI